MRINLLEELLFYLSSLYSHAAFYKAMNDVSQDSLRQTQIVMNAIVKEKRHMIKYIVEGFFPFDDH